MLHIVGGSYYEECRDPAWSELFGSGFRACLALAGKSRIRFHTYADENTSKILHLLCQQVDVDLSVYNSTSSITFYYDHPLANPIFTPSIELLSNIQTFALNDIENVICFGMIEGNPVVKCKRVVYDPQSPGNPISFHANGSTFEELITVLNLKEAIALTGETAIANIGAHLLNVGRSTGAIIKNGAEGAYIIERGKEIQNVPAFLTHKVWPIGSGDVFTSFFGYEYFQGKTLYEAALTASQATATYVNNKALPVIIDTSLQPFIKKEVGKKLCYLAGPFFSMGERWLIEQFRTSLLGIGLAVFSPYHDVGLGSASEVVVPDIEGIHKCDVMIAIVNGFDTGTIFEIGYAKAIGKPVMVFFESSNREELTMLEGTDCFFEDDFSSIVYKTLWEAYKA